MKVRFGHKQNVPSCRLQHFALGTKFGLLLPRHLTPCAIHGLLRGLHLVPCAAHGYLRAQHFAPRALPGYLRTRRLAFAPVVNCSTLDTWTSALCSGCSDCSSLRAPHFAPCADRGYLRAHRLKTPHRQQIALPSTLSARRFAQIAPRSAPLRSALLSDRSDLRALATSALREYLRTPHPPPCAAHGSLRAHHLSSAPLTDYSALDT
jgi:hypothetical protein